MRYKHSTFRRLNFTGIIPAILLTHKHARTVSALHLNHPYPPSFSASGNFTLKRIAAIASTAWKDLIPRSNSSRQLKPFYVTIGRKPCHSNRGDSHTRKDSLAY